ncbi:guanylate kinase [Candidatus Pelagibacter bacterium]|jgi:guanylate kinase|nr:guanylate kinase [Candidatus Pelagibacter bacterium]
MAHDVENIMVILSSPSGVGKTTLTKKIQQKYQSFKISVSSTTRLPRSNEVDGVDYYFVSHEKFKELIKENKFYEHAKIFENYYGTLKKNVDKTILNNDIIFDIDWQGTKQLTKFKNLNLIKIYLITEKKELKKRLIKRNQNSESEIEERFKSFDEDVKHWNDYDYIIINKNLDVCFKQIESIILNNKKKMTFTSHTTE